MNLKRRKWPGQGPSYTSNTTQGCWVLSLLQCRPCKYVCSAGARLMTSKWELSPCDTSWAQWWEHQGLIDTCWKVQRPSKVCQTRKISLQSQENNASHGSCLLAFTHPELVYIAISTYFISILCKQSMQIYLTPHTSLQSLLVFPQQHPLQQQHLAFIKDLASLRDAILHVRRVNENERIIFIFTWKCLEVFRPKTSPAYLVSYQN